MAHLESSLWLALVAWTVMVVAMMLPTITPAARAIAFNGRWSRRQRGPALFAAGYLAVWSAAGCVVIAGMAMADIDVVNPLVISVILILAAGWELTRWKRRLLLGCHRVRPLPPVGRNADKAAVREGCRNGLRCIGSCGPMMVPMALVPHSTGVVLMLFVAAAVAAQKLLTRAANHLRVFAVVLVIAAVVVAAGAPVL